MPIHRGYALMEWQRITREVIECIMCNNSINWRDMATRLQCSVETIKQAIHYDEQQLTTLQDDGLIVFDDESLHVLPEGMPFVRNVAAAVDPMMRDNHKQFSTPV